MQSNKNNNLRRARRERGAYTIEFALVFLIFFSLLYGVICYGIIFTFRIGMQNAAEEGARAGLQYQTSLEKRRLHAQAVAGLRSNWMPSALKSKAVAEICSSNGSGCNASTCTTDWNQRCQIVVTITAIDVEKFLPPLPGFATPEKVVAQASMLLDGRSTP